MHRLSLSSIALSGSGASAASVRQAVEESNSSGTVDFAADDDAGERHGKKKEKKKTGGFQSFGQQRWAVEYKQAVMTSL
jgi:hypothetical protein